MLDESTGNLMLDQKNRPVDRGGHLNDQTAHRQAQHINDWYAKKSGVGGH